MEQGIKESPPSEPLLRCSVGLALVGRSAVTPEAEQSYERRIDGPEEASQPAVILPPTIQPPEPRILRFGITEIEILTCQGKAKVIKLKRSSSLREPPGSPVTGSGDRREGSGGDTLLKTTSLPCMPPGWTVQVQVRRQAPLSPAVITILRLTPPE